MATIEEGLRAFIAVHVKYLLPGAFAAERKVIEEWPKTLPMSLELAALYTQGPYGVEIETGFTPLRIFDFQELERGQIGYRWTKNKDGLSLSSSWPSGYVVFMDDVGGGKPIIAVSSVEVSPVYASYNAEVPFKISDSVGDFFLALSRLIDVVYGEYEIFEVASDDGVDPNFIMRISEEIIPILGEKNFDRFFDYFYG